MVVHLSVLSYLVLIFRYTVRCSLYSTQTVIETQTVVSSELTVTRCRALAPWFAVALDRVPSTVQTRHQSAEAESRLQYTFHFQYCTTPTPTREHEQQQNPKQRADRSL